MADDKIIGSAYIVGTEMAEGFEPPSASLNPPQPDPTSPLDIEAIRERADEATPGPWHAPHEHARNRCVSFGDYGWVTPGPGPHYDEDTEEGKADAEFVAHARTDVPVLLAALAEAQRERDERAVYVEEHRRRIIEGHKTEGEPDCISQVNLNVDQADADALRAEVRRLDHRLRWAYDHLDGDAGASLLTAYKLADQRDAARADAERMRPVVEAAAVYIRTPSLDLSRPHPAPREARALVEAVDTYESQTGGTDGN